jgi:hypothetical protein
MIEITAIPLIGVPSKRNNGHPCHHKDQFWQRLVHIIGTQRDHRPHGHAFPQFNVRKALLVSVRTDFCPAIRDISFCIS